MKWTTKDGRNLLPSEMSTEHLHNTVAMLRRDVEHHRAVAVLNLLRYSETAPDGASIAAEHEAMTLERMDPEEVLLYCFPVYRDLLKELEKRDEKASVVAAVGMPGAAVRRHRRGRFPFRGQ